MSEIVKDEEMVGAEKAPEEACGGGGLGVEGVGGAELLQPLDQLLEGPDLVQLPPNPLLRGSVQVEAPSILAQPPFDERVSEFEAATDDAPNDRPCHSPCLILPEDTNLHSSLDQACEDRPLGFPDATSVQDYLEDHNQDPLESASGTVTNLGPSILPIGVRVNDGSEDVKTRPEEGYLGVIGDGAKEIHDTKHEGADVDSTKMVSLDTNPDDSVKFESQENVDNGPNETFVGSDAKELSIMKGEGSSDHLLEENSSQIIEMTDEKGKEIKCGVDKVGMTAQADFDKEHTKPKLDAGHAAAIGAPHQSFPLVPYVVEGFESGTEEEQEAFRKDVESFYRQNGLEFKAPKFYKEEVNLLKLWRAVIKLGGYEQVTSCKLWRQVGESFRPPKTCTTVSWTFRIFYEKALLEFEKHKLQSGELPFSDGSLLESIRAENQTGANQALGSGRARRDAAARAMQGWHSQRLLDNGEVCHPVIKDKNLSSASKVDKQLKSNGAGLLKRKKPSSDEHTVNVVTPIKMMKPQSDSIVIDIGPPADWVKINVQKTVDCFEIYALVPGLLREEVHVQSDPAGRLIISGQPEQLDNPWGITPFKKVVSLPCRIDPHHTSAVVTLHGQLFVRVPFEHSGH